ncbi:MAG: hypothetical protein K2Q20_02725 [Phycisphaerales bacterium]|nr:hypothetical protein [Phycisphaerales bacterium]
MPKPSKSSKTNTPAPKLSPLTAKSHRSAGGLLGRTGGAGAGLTAPAKSGTPLSEGGALESSKAAKPASAGHNLPTDLGGPAGGNKHPGKPEARRPTGRAISGG